MKYLLFLFLFTLASHDALAQANRISQFPASGITGTLPVANGGTGATTQANALTAILGSSQIPVANGGTGAATFTQNAILKGNAGNPVTPSTVAFDDGDALVLGGTTGYSDGAIGKPPITMIATTGSRAGGVVKVATGSDSTPMISFANSNGPVGQITTNGSATAYSTSSDARLKTNIAPLTGSGEIIDALRPVTFDWRSDGEHAEGFIAQELYEVIPAAVSVGDDNPDLKQGDEGFKPWAVDFSKIVPVLVAEVKELRRRLDDLETK